MAQKMEDSTVIIKHSHIFEVDIERKLNLQGKGDFVEGEKFSPVHGLVFQLRILNKDNDKFIISLKNCGKESVKVLNFEVKSDLSSKQFEQKNFWLLPDGMMDLPDLFFNYFRYRHPLTAWVDPAELDKEQNWFTEYYKYFRCSLEIEGGNCIDILIELKCSVLSFTCTWRIFK